MIKLIKCNLWQSTLGNTFKGRLFTSPQAYEIAFNTNNIKTYNKQYMNTTTNLACPHKSTCIAKGLWPFRTTSHHWSRLLTDATVSTAKKI